MEKSDTYFDDGTTKLEAGDYLSANQAFNKAIELNPNYMIAYAPRGIAKYELKNYVGSIMDCNEFIASNPDVSSHHLFFAYLYRGKSKYNLQDYRGAIEDYTKDIDLNPYFAAAYFYNA